MLLALILMPLIAAGLMLLLDARAPASRARAVALVATLLTLGMAAVVAAEFIQLPALYAKERGVITPRLLWSHPWLEYTTSASVEPIRFDFVLGVDGISLALILLTAILCVCCVLISWEAVQQRAAEFYAMLLILESGMLGAFCAFDLLLFYVFFELTLVPLFLLVGIWGGPLRQYAAMKFFVYTLAGSLVTLLGLIGLVWALQERAHLSQPFYLPELARAAWQHRLPVSTQIPLFWMVVAGFLVKVPVFPWHTWLPLAHVEAPTAGSVLLAGVLLKLGTYGMLRLCLPLLPDATRLSGVPWLGALAVVGIIYGSLCALAQQDIKRLVAYSSVAHLGFCVLGLMALNPVGLTGSVLQMINHGLSTGGLFCLVGTLYERYHTRHLADLGGLASRFPRLGVLMTWIALASIGLPGMNGFVGEMLSLAGMFQATHTQGMLYAALGATGVILGAWYLLNVLRIAFFGTIREPATDHPISDLNLREMLALFPLAALCLLLGIFPQPLINLIEPDLLPLCEVLRRGMFAGS